MTQTRLHMPRGRWLSTASDPADEGGCATMRDRVKGMFGLFRERLHQIPSTSCLKPLYKGFKLL